MPIVTDQGINTAKLCENSKKYLSHILANRIVVGARIKDPNFVSWKEVLGRPKEKLGAHLVKRLAWQLRENAAYDGPHNNESFKQHIVNTLITLEYQHLEQIPEYKKQQAKLRHKKRALISLTILAALATVFFFALPVLGGAAILVGVVSALIGTGLLSYSVSAFVGEKLIDSEWIAECSHKKNQFLQKMDKEKTQAKYTKIIKTTNKTPTSEKYKRACPQKFLDKARLSTIIEEVDNENEIKSRQIPVVKTVAENEMQISNSKIRLTADATTQTPSDDKSMSKPSITYNVSFFIPLKTSLDPIQNFISHSYI
ncbi:hypothetical protein [Rickettsiella endosymbiont of Rhagonycha lignosa]|uniref:hypothetical protein n=1 Tax=Rickettsiella endosymbiont of Rhagonycha lignosa TaxID=3077937 RepID=UPI00313B9D3A